ncbi:glycosyltransferase family 2 protein [uncultured Hoeflea sp.]|uniref:glycosyltransferase family 2 protein n=1 Tax=uncultured Hoeflea sp. TaxID=538666 RepID=UPI0030D790FD
MRRLGAVILTHNSDDDLPESLAGLLAQRGVLLDIIIVDNASCPARLERMRNAFRAALPAGHHIEAGADAPGGYSCGDGVFITNPVNSGYSAGNNLGARLAVALGSEAVLIVNPDVRIAASDHLLRLSDALFRDEQTAVAGPAIRNLGGMNENPMFEPSFLQELLAPLLMAAAILPVRRGRNRQAPRRRDEAVVKLSGCCFLVRRSFLEEIGYFDQNVFLYCEEAILAAQMRKAGRRSAYVADLEAIHAHRPSTKGDPARRQRLWSRSRRYYHARYLGYGKVRRTALAISHALVIALSWAQSRVSGGAG